MFLGASCASGQDWPQWRGPNRDNKVSDFRAPAVWPKELTKKWQVTVGAGDSSPVLVGDKVYVFARQGDSEVTSCIDAGSGKVLWQDKYASQPAGGSAGGIHAGPRATPAVAEGKVCTFGVRGVLSCLDAASGNVVWRKDSKTWPQFFAASSPIIAQGLCIAQLGGKGSGEIVAFNLASGTEQWKWTGESPGYGSPVLMTAAGTTHIVAPTARSIVGISLADGKLLWQTPFESKQATGTPIIHGDSVIISGPPAGTVAVKIEKANGAFAAKPLWQKPQTAHRYNTPTLKDGMLFGLSPAGRNSALFCMNAKTGEMLWNDSTRLGECGTVLDAGSVLLTLTSDSELIVFPPSNKAFTEIARYKVADSPTWAYPIVSGNRVFVKDQNNLTLWTIE
jgi:outer membrane protein assembly factor BamB